MEIIELYPPYIFSIKYDGQNENEFDRLFTEWNDVEKIMNFLITNQSHLKTDIWNKVTEPETAARQIMEEARELEFLFEKLNEMSISGRKPDFDSHFKYLDGKYKYEIEYQPMKSYGNIRPSLIRLYAIKMSTNTYLITGGGIKLADSIYNILQDCKTM